MQRAKRMQKGFTLLEILLVIAAIGLLAAIILVAINPNRQLAQARDAQRRLDINTIYKASEQYLIDNGIYPSGVNSNLKEICNTGNKTLTDTLSPATLCDNKADLRVLVPTYLAAIPTAPSGGIYRIGINGNNKIAAYTIGENSQTIAINFDVDARAYITAIELADGQALEENVKIAIYNFIVGLKTDGIWEPIKASVIMAGARTLTGALVPLKGTAPTNNNFVSGDYNRKTGLVGDGSTKYLNSNRLQDADPVSSFHMAVMLSSIGKGGNARYIGAYGGPGLSDDFLASDGDLRNRSRDTAANMNMAIGLFGTSRSNDTTFVVRSNRANVDGLTTIARTTGSQNHFVFAQNDNGSVFERSNPRLAFYSIGEALDLALLDARVTKLMTDLGNAIP